MNNLIIKTKVDILNGIIYVIIFFNVAFLGIMITYKTLVSTLVLIIEKEKTSAFQALEGESHFMILVAFIAYIILMYSIKPVYKEVCRYFLPKLYCNEYVKKFINRKELKQILSNETF